jgi:hypothetical protein
MPAIAAQVNRDAVGAGLFTNHRCRDETWFRRAPRLSHSGDVINVDVKSCCHEFVKW